MTVPHRIILKTPFVYHCVLFQILYLSVFGGANINETANDVFKNAVKDSLTPSLTWKGREQGTLALEKTTLAKAFYGKKNSWIHLEVLFVILM